MFFDDYPQFFETSQVFAHRGRLNLRYEAIFAANRDIFEGARVLDLASHDGRWSFAALRTGATHVTGIEARETAVDRARETFAHYGEDPESYRFVCGDIFDVLGNEKFDVDVVLCLGYLYHTYRHTELLRRIRDLEPNHVIVDTNVVPRVEQPFVKLFVDRAHKPGEAALDAYSHEDKTLVGRPSAPALRMMLQAYDFEVEHTYDWDALRAAHPEVDKLGDYADGKRVTMRCRSGVSASTAEPPAASAVSGGPTEQPPPGPSLATNGSQGRDLTQAGKTSAQSSSGGRWRHLVNRGLVKATGYELRRVRPSRRD